MPVARAVGLGKTYLDRAGAAHTALTGFTASFDPGTCVGVLGASGAGKTTLCRLLVGLLRPTQGAVQHIPLDASLPAVRHPVGYFAAQARPPAVLTPREWLAGWSAASRPPDGNRAVMEEIAGRNGLSDVMDVRCGQMSPLCQWGVQRTQIDLLDPPFVVIDDPVPSGDEEAGIAMGTWVGFLLAAGKAVCWATPHAARLELRGGRETAVADSLVLLDRGVVVVRGTIEEWKQRSFTTTLDAAMIWHLDQHRALPEEHG